MNKEIMTINGILSDYYARTKAEMEADPLLREYVMLSQAFEKGLSATFEASRMLALGWKNHPDRLAMEKFLEIHPEYAVHG